jgi:hypothetical protein
MKEDRNNGLMLYIQLLVFVILELDRVKSLQISTTATPMFKNSFTLIEVPDISDTILIPDSNI